MKRPIFSIFFKKALLWTLLSKVGKGLLNQAVAIKSTPPNTECPGESDFYLTWILHQFPINYGRIVSPGITPNTPLFSYGLKILLTITQPSKSRGGKHQRRFLVMPRIRYWSNEAKVHPIQNHRSHIISSVANPSEDFTRWLCIWKDLCKFC